MNKINKIDWEFYLERHGQPPYLVSAFMPCEGVAMKKATGFGFDYHLQEYKNDIAFYYRSKKETQKCDQYFSDFVSNKKNKKKLEQWYKKSLDCQKKIEKLIIDFRKGVSDEYVIKNYQKTSNLCEETLTYTTCVAYFVLKGIEKALNDGEVRKSEVANATKNFEKIRSKSYPAEITSVIFARIWEAASNLSGGKIPVKDFSFLSPEEFSLYLTRKKMPEKKEIKKRSEWCIFWSIKGGDKVTFSTDKKDKNIVKNLLDINTEKVDTIKGSPAFLGKAKGRVCIVNSTKDIDKIKTDDILVSVNTNPSLMPAVLKCKAIVTDEGGITCHAAIISREMKKPCVTGTKNATKVLKDGMMVEVDANTGIVKIIK